jgi:hypothetical protein
VTVPLDPLYFEERAAVIKATDVRR